MGYNSKYTGSEIESALDNAQGVAYNATLKSVVIGGSTGQATATGAVACGKGIASGANSFCGGTNVVGTNNMCESSGNSSLSFGAGNLASGEASFTTGVSNVASGSCSTALGQKTTASGKCSVCFGWSVALGGKTYLPEASGQASFVAGQGSRARGSQSVAMGQANDSQLALSYTFGSQCVTEASRTIAMGQSCTTYHRCQTVLGSYNKIGLVNTSFDAANDALVIGCGKSEEERANAFRVCFDGTVYAGKFDSSGADYAEFFEWYDGNPDGEDRIGHFVTLVGDKIKIAETGDDVIGVVSGNGSVIGDAYEDMWVGTYERDVFNRYVYEDIEVEEEVVDDEADENGNATTHIETRTDRVLKKSADYDPSMQYVPRSQRKEWDAVGFLGKLITIDDGTCVVGSRCGVNADGIATAGADYRVIKRLDSTHIVILANFL